MKQGLGLLTVIRSYMGNHRMPLVLISRVWSQVLEWSVCDRLTPLGTVIPSSSGLVVESSDIEIFYALGRPGMRNI